MKMITDRDLDGIMCYVMASLMHGEIDVKYVNKGIDRELWDFEKEIEQTKEKLIVCDKKISQKSVIRLQKKKINIEQYDHHEKNKVNFLWQHNDQNECATSLFYKKNEKDLKKYKELGDIVKAVKAIDLWQIEEGDRKYFDYGEALDILRKKKSVRVFGEEMLKRIRDGKEIITKEEWGEINLEKQKKREKIDKCKKEMVDFYEGFGKIAVVEADEHISYLAHEILKKDKAIKVVMLFNKRSRVVSLRTNKDGINLNEIAKKKKGGGHPKAAAFILSKEEAEKFDQMIQEQKNRKKRKERKQMRKNEQKRIPLERKEKNEVLAIFEEERKGCLNGHREIRKNKKRIRG